jgi:hypothetical protein
MRSLVVLSMLIMCSCSGHDAIETRSAGNGVKVELLFSHDGCKMYRFYDYEHYHYYTNCGQTMSMQNCGKNCVREETISQ